MGRIHSALIALGVVVGTAGADEVILVDGARLTGKTAWEGESLRVTTRIGEVTFAREQVKEVIACELPEEELARRVRTLAKHDLRGALELARFALENALEPEARRLLLAIQRRPVDAEESEQHTLARDQSVELLTRTLDFHLVDGTWVPPEEYWPARGMVKQGGKWVLAAEAGQARIAREQSAGKRVVKSASQRAIRAQDAVERAEEEVARAREKLAGSRQAASRADRLRDEVNARLVAEQAAERASSAEVKRTKRALEVHDEETECKVADCSRCGVCQESCGCKAGKRRARLAREIADAEVAREKARAAVVASERELGAAEKSLDKARDVAQRDEDKLSYAEGQLAERRAYLKQAEDTIEEAAR